MNKPVEGEIEVVWQALHAYREDLIPEGDSDYDATWERVCEAMARVEEALGIDSVSEFRQEEGDSEPKIRVLWAGLQPMQPDHQDTLEFWLGGKIKIVHRVLTLLPEGSHEAMKELVEMAREQNVQAIATWNGLRPNIVARYSVERAKEFLPTAWQSTYGALPPLYVRVQQDNEGHWEQF